MMMMVVFWLALLFALPTTTNAQDCMQPPCIQIVAEATATKLDSADITTSGQIPAALLTRYTLFSSINYLYAVSTDGSSIKITDQVAWGQYSSRGVAIGKN